VPTYNPSLLARRDVSISSCTQAAGAWKVTGTIENSKDVARNYVIVVDFTTQRYTVQDTKVVAVNDVGGGKSADWSATGAPGKSNLLCVIRTAQARPA
jgi:hypothetical protein